MGLRQPGGKQSVMGKVVNYKVLLSQCATVRQIIYLRTQRFDFPTVLEGYYSSH